MMSREMFKAVADQSSLTPTRAPLMIEVFDQSEWHIAEMLNADLESVLILLKGKRRLLLPWGKVRLPWNTIYVTQWFDGARYLPLRYGVYDLRRKDRSTIWAGCHPEAKIFSEQGVRAEYRNNSWTYENPRVEARARDIVSYGSHSFEWRGIHEDSKALAYGDVK